MLPVSRTTYALPSPIDFPARIQAALGRLAGRVGACALLPPTARLLLAELVRCLDYKNPTEPIRIRNATLAAALNLSERTVGSLKCILERNGWITRHQVQSRRRGMQVADVWLSPLALTALGFSPPPVDIQGASNPQVQRKRRQPDADAYLIPQPSSKGHQASPEIVEKRSSSNRPLSQSELEHLERLQLLYGEDLEGMPEDVADMSALPPKLSRNVPPDLTLLSRLGLSDAAVYKLMGLASRKQCRLGHVVAVAGKAIQKARKVYSYVAKLLDSKRDWATAAASIRTLPEKCSVGDEVVGEAAYPRAEVLHADDAKQLAPETHERLAAGLLVDKEKGVAWRLVRGLIEEIPLFTLTLPKEATHLAHPSGLHQLVTNWRSTPRSKESYACLGRRLERGVADGRVVWCAEADIRQLAISVRNELDLMKSSIPAGHCVVNTLLGVAWRYVLGRLEQTPLRPYAGRTGHALPWALQLSADVERKVARDYAEGRAVVMTLNEVENFRPSYAVTPEQSMANEQITDVSSLISRLLK